MRLEVNTLTAHPHGVSSPTRDLRSDAPLAVREGASLLAHPLASTGVVAFCYGAELGSVQGAADALGLTQSAITKRIQSLERRVGVQLFERGRFGLRLTPVGRRVLPRAVAALQALDATAAEAAAALHEAFVIASEMPLEAARPLGWPSTTLVGVLRADADGVFAAVRSGTADIGVVAGPVLASDFAQLRLSGLSVEPDGPHACEIPIADVLTVIRPLGPATDGAAELWTWLDHELGSPADDSLV